MTKQPKALPLGATRLTSTLVEFEGGMSVMFSLEGVGEFTMKQPARLVAHEHAQILAIADYMRRHPQVDFNLLANKAVELTNIANNVLVEACIAKYPKCFEELFDDRLPIRLGWWESFSLWQETSKVEGDCVHFEYNRMSDRLLIAAKYVCGLATQSEMVAVFERAELLGVEGQAEKRIARRL